MKINTSHISDDYIRSKYNLKNQALKSGHVIEVIKDSYFLNASLDQLCNIANNLRKQYPGASFEVNNILIDYEEPSVEFFILRSCDETEEETIERLKLQELEFIEKQYQVYCSAENYLNSALNFRINKPNEII